MPITDFFKCYRPTIEDQAQIGALEKNIAELQKASQAIKKLNNDILNTAKTYLNQLDKSAPDAKPTAGNQFYRKCTRITATLLVLASAGMIAWGDHTDNTPLEQAGASLAIADLAFFFLSEAYLGDRIDENFEELLKHAPLQFRDVFQQELSATLLNVNHLVSANKSNSLHVPGDKNNGSKLLAVLEQAEKKISNAIAENTLQKKQYRLPPNKRALQNNLVESSESARSATFSQV